MAANNFSYADDDPNLQKKRQIEQRGQYSLLYLQNSTLKMQKKKEKTKQSYSTQTRTCLIMNHWTQYDMMTMLVEAADAKQPFDSLTAVVGVLCCSVIVTLTLWYQQS